MNTIITVKLTFNDRSISRGIDVMVNENIMVKLTARDIDQRGPRRDVLTYHYGKTHILRHIDQRGFRRDC